MSPATELAQFWVQDPAVQRLSATERGILIEILCRIMDSGSRSVAIDLATWGAFMQVPAEQLVDGLLAISERGIIEVGPRDEGIWMAVWLRDDAGFRPVNGSEVQSTSMEMARQTINRWFRRRPSTQWSDRENRALAKVLALGPIAEDWELLDRYYMAEIDPAKDFRRRHLLTLLNNWNGEADRARRGVEPNSHGLSSVAASIRIALAKHPCNPRSVFHDPQAGPDLQDAYKQLRRRLKDLDGHRG